MYSNRPESIRRSFKVGLIYNPRGFYENETPIEGCDPKCQDFYELLVLKSAEEEFAPFFPRIVAPHQQESQLDIKVARFVKRFADSMTLGSNSAFDRGIVTDERMAATKQVVAAITAEMSKAAPKILVTHSQANLLANLAWASVVADLGQEAQKRSRTINLANTSLFAISNLNLTHDRDDALANLVVEPLALKFTRNTIACTGMCQFDLAHPTFKAPQEFVCGGTACNHSMATYLGLDEIPVALVDQSVEFTAGRTAFFDRFEDLVYAAIISLEANALPPYVIAVEPGPNGGIVREGSPLIFTVILSSPTTRSTSFAFSIGGGSAGSDDYGPPTFSSDITVNAESGTLTVSAGLTSFIVTVPTTQDAFKEGYETIPLSVDGVSGMGIIGDDD